MNNTDEILKKILLNMKYDPKKSLKEQTSVSTSVKKSNPGNYDLTTRKLISCIDGTDYVSPNITILEKFEPLNSQEWTDWQTKLVSENKRNQLTACKYQATIKIQQKRTQLSYDDEVIDCINFSYQAYNNKPNFCATHFSLYVKSLDDGSDDVKKFFKEVYLTVDDWFLGEYRKYQQNNNYLTKEPYEIINNKSYKIWDGKYYKPITLSSVIEDEKDLDIKSQQFYNKVDVETFLPLTNAEKGQFNDIPFTKDDEFKNSGKYICKKSDTSMVNLRTSNEVNTDTGIFDPTDNYINWTGDEIIGEYIGEKWGHIQYATGSAFGGTTPNAKLDKWMKSLNNNDVIEIYKSVGGSVPEGKIQSAKSNLPGLLNSVIDNKPAIELIPEKYRNDIIKFGVSHKWYHVKFLKPYKDQTDNDTYKDGWVRSDNTQFCLPASDKKSETNYRLEYLKRIPMKPFADPGVM